jgi:hypothetical protein
MKNNNKAKMQDRLKEKTNGKHEKNMIYAR